MTRMRWGRLGPRSREAVNEEEGTRDVSQKSWMQLFHVLIHQPLTTSAIRLEAWATRGIPR